MALYHDWRVLYHMLLSPITGQSHAERLENFYQGQAAHYDHFRTRLLHGRRDLIQALTFSSEGIWDGGVWVDMGGGTASNLVEAEDQLQQLAQAYVVDLSPSLLNIAQQRICNHGWTNVTLVEGDATSFTPPDMPVDLITFSYALTMIPDWFAAIDHAWQLLRPGGMIGVIDFYVSRKYPRPFHQCHRWLPRTLWPIWFGFDNVFPSPDHLPYLHHRFDAHTVSECIGPVPYTPGLRMPYYLFIGKKPESSQSP